MVRRYEEYQELAGIGQEIRGEFGECDEIRRDMKRYEEIRGEQCASEEMQEIQGLMSKYEEMRSDRMRYEEIRGDTNRCVGSKKFLMALKSIQARGDKRRYRKW